MSDSKACTDCGETIRMAAVKCRHCGVAQDERELERLRGVPSVWDRKVSLVAVMLLCGGGILLCGALWWMVQALDPVVRQHAPERLEGAMIFGGVALVCMTAGAVMAAANLRAWRYPPAAPIEFKMVVQTLGACALIGLLMPVIGYFDDSRRSRPPAPRPAPVTSGSLPGSSAPR